MTEKGVIPRGALNKSTLTPLCLTKSRLKSSTKLISLALFVIGLLLCLFLDSLQGHTQEKIHLAFVYPGGEGDALDAQPVLDRLSLYLKEKFSLHLECRYYPDLNESLKALKQWPAHAGIVSYDFYATQQATLSMQKVLATKTLASGKAEEHYTLVVPETQNQPQNIKTIYISRPLPLSFITDQILEASLGIDFKTVTWATARLSLAQLKKMALEQTPEAFLLDSHEYRSFKVLKTDWVPKLKPIYSSKAIPTSPVVFFKKDGAPNELQKLTQALVQIEKTSEGKAILESLRLSGFEQP